MKRFIFFGLIVLSVFAVSKAQTDSLTLLQCLLATRSNAQIRPQIETYNEISELAISGKNATYLPSLSAYGKAWYQSDAVTVSVPGVGDFLQIDKFQYNMGLEADQMIYDGGITRKGKDLEKVTYSSQINRVENELYQLNNQVVDFFFKSLLLSKNKDVMALKENILQKRLLELESAYKNGVISESEVGKMRAELLKTYQNIMEIEKYQSQTLSALEILTGIKIDTNTKFVDSDSVAHFVTAVRPEDKYFDTELMKLDKMARLNSTKNLPKLYAYGQAGYSYPGLNFFENQSDYYYIVGARLSWTIFDWNENKRQTQIIRKQKEIVNTTREDFNQKMKMSSSNEQIEQEKLLQLIKLDEQIIEQRIFVSEASASALKNGTITTSRYLEDLNAEIIARIELETHKIQYQSSQARSYLIEGIDFSAIKTDE